MTPHEQPQQNTTYIEDCSKGGPHLYDFKTDSCSKCGYGNPQPSKEGDVREKIEEIIDKYCPDGSESNGDAVEAYEYFVDRLLTLFQSLLKEERERTEKLGQDKICRELAIFLKEHPMKNEQGNWVILISDRLARELLASLTHDTTQE